MKRSWMRMVATGAILAALAVAVGACGGDDDEETGGATSAEETGEAVSTETGAAALRAHLTALLGEHVELAGIAFVKGVGNGLDSAEYEAAAAALDQNSKGLAGAIGGVYGEAAGDQFLDLWRAHIGFFVDYTKGKAGGDEAAARKAQGDLDGYRQDFGAFLSSANPELTKRAVADALKPHVDSVFTVIDAVVSGKGDPFALLQEAVNHMPETAATLSGAISTQMPEEFDGAADSGASELRAGLTHLLQQHVYAAAIAIDTGVGAGLESGEYEAAAAALDQNSKGLAGAIGGVYGEAAGDQFLDLWRAHIGFFVDYTKGKAGGDEAAARKAQGDLDGYRQDFGAFLSSANPELTKRAVADALKPHVDSVFTVIDDVVAGEPQVFDDLRAAAAHMPETANTLAGAIAAQFPEMFGS